jgi:hypothetical protein
MRTIDAMAYFQKGNSFARCENRSPLETLRNSKYAQAESQRT